MNSLKEDKIKTKVKIMCVDMAMTEDDIIIVVVLVSTKGRIIWFLKVILQEAIVIVVA